MDRRIGSKHYLPLLRERGIPAKIVTLPFADLAFCGTGPEEKPVTVGIEVKRVGDLLRCIVDGRFVGHQLPGLQAAYAFVYLVVEDEYQAGRAGELLVRKGRKKRQWTTPPGGLGCWMYASLEHWLTTVSILGGVQVYRSPSPDATADWLGALHSWWEKDWRDHTALKAFDTSGPNAARVQLRPPTLLQRVAKEMPMVGWERSQVVAHAFSSVRAMVNAGERDWLRIAGIGPTIAKAVVRAIREGE